MDATAQTSGSRGVFLARVKSNVPLCPEHYRLVLEVQDFPPSRPGQFVQILCAAPLQRDHLSATFIRRPFSIGGLRREPVDRPERGMYELDIYHRVIGP